MLGECYIQQSVDNDRGEPINVCSLIPFESKVEIPQPFPQKQVICENGHKGPPKVKIPPIFPSDFELNIPNVFINDSTNSQMIHPQNQPRSHHTFSLQQNNLQKSSKIAQPKICKKSTQNAEHNSFQEEFYKSIVGDVRGKNKISKKIVLKIHKHIYKDAEVEMYKRKHERSISTYFEDFAPFKFQIIGAIYKKRDEILNFDEIKAITDAKMSLNE